MELQHEIEKRFSDVIGELIKPPILIGPKWLRPCPNGKPADFQFFGVPKIAKASGRSPQRVVQMLLKRLDLSDLGLKVEVLANHTLNLSRKASTPTPPAPGADGAAAKPEADTPAGSGAPSSPPTAAHPPDAKSGEPAPPGA